MAVTGITPVQRPAPIVKKKKGGGQLGEILGSIGGGTVGGVAGFISGGPVGAIKGAMEGAAVGGRLGNMAGEAIQPTKTKVIEQGAPPAMVVSQNSLKIRDAMKALREYPPEIKEELAPPLIAGLLKDMQMNNPGFGVQQQQGLGDLMGGGQQQPPPTGLQVLAQQRQQGLGSFV